jgi:hypothetical protein
VKTKHRPTAQCWVPVLTVNRGAPNGRPNRRSDGRRREGRPEGERVELESGFLCRKRCSPAILDFLSTTDAGG